MAFERWTELLVTNLDLFPQLSHKMVLLWIGCHHWFYQGKRGCGVSSRVLLEGGAWRVSTGVTGEGHADLFTLSVLLPLLCFGFDILCVGYRSYSVAKG
jgi:hypothetical protein